MTEYHEWRLDKTNLAAGPISSSMLKGFAQNPYAWTKAGEFKVTPAMRTGTLFDAAITDPDELSELLPKPDTLPEMELSPFDSFRTKDARAWKAEKEAAGIVVTTEDKRRDLEQGYAEKMIKWQDQMDHLMAAREAVYSHPIAGEMVRDAEFQVGIIGDIAGTPAKCLLDILPSAAGDFSETLVDFKTISTGIDDESIRNAIGRFKYHWQAAFYYSLFNNASPDRVCEDFAFIFQDISTLEVRVVTLNDDALMLGSRSVAAALKKYFTCAEYGIKSEYLETNDEMGLMPYHSTAEDDELARMEGGEND